MIHLKKNQFLTNNPFLTIKQFFYLKVWEKIDSRFLGGGIKPALLQTKSG